MPCHAMPCHAMLCHAMPCHAMPCHAMPCHAMPCHSMLCYAMLCYAMLCYAMLCYAMLRYGYFTDMYRRNQTWLNIIRQVQMLISQSKLYTNKRIRLWTIWVSHFLLFPKYKSLTHFWRLFYGNSNQFEVCCTYNIHQFNLYINIGGEVMVGVQNSCYSSISDSFTYKTRSIGVHHANT